MAKRIHGLIAWGTVAAVMVAIFTLATYRHCADTGDPWWMVGAGYLIVIALTIPFVNVAQYRREDS